MTAKTKVMFCVVKVSTSSWCFIIKSDVSLNKHSNFWQKKSLKTHPYNFNYTVKTKRLKAGILHLHKYEQFQYLYSFWISIILLICIPHNIFVLSTYLKTWLSQFQSHLVLRRLYSFTETKIWKYLFIAKCKIVVLIDC